MGVHECVCTVRVWDTADSGRGSCVCCGGWDKYRKKRMRNDREKKSNKTQSKTKQKNKARCALLL